MYNCGSLDRCEGGTCISVVVSVEFLSTLRKQGNVLTTVAGDSFRFRREELQRLDSQRQTVRHTPGILTKPLHFGTCLKEPFAGPSHPLCRLLVFAPRLIFPCAAFRSILSLSSLLSLGWSLESWRMSCCGTTGRFLPCCHTTVGHRKGSGGEIHDSQNHKAARHKYCSISVPCIFNCKNPEHVMNVRRPHHFMDCWFALCAAYSLRETTSWNSMVLS